MVTVCKRGRPVSGDGLLSVTCSAWQAMKTVAAEELLIEAAYKRQFGEHSRVYQLTKMYLFNPSSGLFSCPLAMTDGAAKTLEVSCGRLQKLYSPSKLWRGCDNMLLEMCGLWNMKHVADNLWFCLKGMCHGRNVTILFVSGQGVKTDHLKVAYKHLTSRNPSEFWTSGQWMTEKRGSRQNSPCGITIRFTSRPPSWTYTKLTFPLRTTGNNEYCFS